MGCPKDVESHPRYQRWMYIRGVELATAAGMAPDYILFEDENFNENLVEEDQAAKKIELRCRRCRYVPHQIFVLLMSHTTAIVC